MMFLYVINSCLSINFLRKQLLVAYLPSDFYFANLPSDVFICYMLLIVVINSCLI